MLIVLQILNNMKAIKLYAWTKAFSKRLNYIRNEKELGTLRKIGASQAIANFTWSTTPFLVSCSSFTLFVLIQNKPLTTDIVFPALTLFNLLTFPLAILPMVITAIVEASVAVERITNFFLAEELQSDAVLIEKPVDEVGDESVLVRGATFTWNKYGDKRVLEDIDFSAKKGDLVCVVGRVGAGKSSFLQSLLGDLWKIRGEVVLRGHSAYVAQSTWVMNASVKENVVFGHRWDAKFYRQTIHACALTDDISSLPDGDQTEVGEKGISLSGGQKARLTLARAVYARADIYLLDDILSAVDQHVGRHIIDNVLGSKGLLARKTRILATNSITVLKEANYIYLLKEGHVVESSTYQDAMSRKGDIAQLANTSSNEGSPNDSDESDEDKSSGEETVYADFADEDDAVADSAIVENGTTSIAPIKPGSDVLRKSSFATLRRASTASFRGPRGKIVDEESAPQLKSRQTKEFMEQGKVKWNVYAEYAKTGNLPVVFVYLIALVAAQTAQIGASVWLKRWSEINGEYGGNPEVGKYIGVYFAFGFGSAALVVVQTLILWIFCSIEVSDGLLFTEKGIFRY